MLRALDEDSDSDFDGYVLHEDNWEESVEESMEVSVEESEEEGEEERVMRRVSSSHSSHSSQLALPPPTLACRSTNIEVAALWI